MAKIETYTDDITREHFTDDDEGTAHVTVEVNGYGRVRLDLGVASVNDLLGLAPLTNAEGQNVNHEGVILGENDPPIMLYTRGELVTKGRGKGIALASAAVAAVNGAGDTPPTDSADAAKELAADADAASGDNGAPPENEGDTPAEPRRSRSRAS